MRSKLLSVFFFLVFTTTFSQSWQWAQRAGGTGSDKATDLDIDANGNTYIGGYYNVGQPASFQATFGAITPSLNASSWGKEGFLAKIDKAGNWQWVTSALGGYDDRILGVCVDKINSSVYTTGTFWDWGGFNSLAFGTCSINTTASSGNDQIFIGKTNLNGNCQWLLSAGCEDGDDHGYDAITDPQGNVYVTGFVSNLYSLSPASAVFGTFSVTLNYDDSLLFLAKISPTGVFQWVRSFGNCDGERDNRLAIDNANNVYVAGGFHGTQSFGTTTLSSTNNGIDIFVTKYDQFGNHIWAKRAGGILDDRANGITVDPTTQKIYVTGEFRDYAYFDLDTINNNGGPNGRDIFVAKMNTSGNWLWAKKAGSKSGDERGNSICSNNKGNIFVTGQFVDTAKFGPIVTLISNPTTTVDAFVAAIDSLGKWQWALKGGGVNEDRGNSIACDDSCYLYTAGYYQGPVTFGANNLAAYGSKDIYAARISNACFSYITFIDESDAVLQSAVLFPNPAYDNIQIKISGENFSASKARVIITDMIGREIEIAPVLNDHNLAFNISSLSPGVYSINLIYGDKLKVIKFIKQ